MASVDRQPSLVTEIRSLRSRVSEVERPTRAVCILEGGTANIDTSGFVSFPTVVEDTAGMFDPADPIKVTIQRKGIYAVSAFGQIEPGSGIRSLDIAATVQVSPGNFETIQVGFSTPADGTNGWRGAPSMTYPLDVGDTVHLVAGAAAAGLTCSGGRLSVVWVSPGPS